MRTAWHRAPLLSLGAAGMAATLCLWSYAAARQEALVADQTGWLALAVTAAVISGVGNGCFLILRRRAVAVRRAQLLGTDRLDRVGPPGPAPSPRLVSGPGMTRFHRSGCSLVAGKAVSAADRRSHDRAGRRPCDWCRP